ncbi:MAG: M23 family metallopeptidase [Pseudomonadota bacterium]
MKITTFFLLCFMSHLTWASTVSWEGDAQQGGYLIGKTHPAAKVMLDNKKVAVTPQGYFFLGFGRDAGASVMVTIIHPQTGEYQENLRIRQRDYKIERINGLPPSKVNPQSETQLKRIREDIRQVKAARTQFFPREDFLTDFEWPVTGRISGVYGSQRVLNGTPKRPHYGVDIAAPKGTKVMSPNSGVVTLVHSDMYYTGGTLIIDHGYGVSSTFIHLSDIFVKEGQQVTKGELIAAVGSTGRSTGPHLDWRINWFSVRLDPQLFVEPMPSSSVKTSTKKP